MVVVVCVGVVWVVVVWVVVCTGAASVAGAATTGELVGVPVEELLVRCGESLVVELLPLVLWPVCVALPCVDVAAFFV